MGFFIATAIRETYKHGFAMLGLRLLAGGGPFEADTAYSKSSYSGYTQPNSRSRRNLTQLNVKERERYGKDYWHCPWR